MPDEADEAAAGGAPERIGRYRVIGEIGRGGMAVVYRAVLDGPRGFAKEVCVKRILPGAAADPTMVDMFEREARIAATLQHANVVQVFDFDQFAGAPFLVMELVDGPSLWEIFGAAVRAGRPLPIPVACGIVVQALAGLHHVHTRTVGGRPMGLVHRDVSLHNLLVARSGEVKVADFGIARATQLGERTRTGVLKGKLAYIAPEYAATGKADRRGDLFSAGVVLHELLAGRRRIPPATDAEGLGWVLHPVFAPLAALRPEVPDRLAALVAALVAALPDDRPNDAAEAAARIVEVVAPADAAEIARCVAALLPGPEDRARDPTLVAVGPAETLGATVPTPSPFDPTVTRVPTGTVAEPLHPSIRTELTPDASTALAAPARRPPARRAALRRLAVRAGGALLGVAAVLVLVFGLWSGKGRGGTAARRSGPPGGAPAAVAPEPPAALARVAEPPAAAERDAGATDHDAAPPGDAATDVAGETAGPGGAAGADVEPGDAGEPEASRARDAAPAAADARHAASDGGAAGRRDAAGHAESATGTLFVSVRPWAYVAIDDASAGEVAAQNFTVAAGPHRVRIDNDRIPCHLREPVIVPAGGRAEVVVNLAERCAGIADAAP